MRTNLFIFFFLFISVSNLTAQNVADTGFTTRVINFEWMPNGNLVLGIMKFDKSRKLPPSSGVFIFDSKNKTILPLLTGASNPAISPDGKTLAYTKSKDSKNRIFLFDMNSRQENELSRDTLIQSSPQWSPDGKTIVFTNMTGSGKDAILDIYTADISSRTTKEILPGGKYKNYNPVWSPDGKWIVYYLEKGDNRDQVYLTDRNGSFQKNITNDTSTHNFYPSWFGIKILYTWSPNKLAIINSDGSGRQVIEGIKTFFARYSPKENKIAYIQVPENALMLYDVNSKKSEMLIDAGMLTGIL